MVAIEREGSFFVTQGASELLSPAAVASCRNECCGRQCDEKGYELDDGVGTHSGHLGRGDGDAGELQAFDWVVTKWENNVDSQQTQ